MDTPLVSVNIITHNRSKYISQAIMSVIGQDFTNLELIIIDDASTDNTGEIVKPFLRDERVKYYLLPKQKNIAAVRNYALQVSSGKYIAVLDSDDIWCNNAKLRQQVNYLENNLEVVCVGSGATLIGGSGEVLRSIIKPVYDSEIKQDLLLKNPFFHSSVMYRNEIIKKNGGYDENINYGEDFDLWLRIGKVGKFYNFREEFINYRVHNDNETSKHFGRAVIDVFRVISKNRKKYGLDWTIFVKKIFGKFIEYFDK